MRRIVACMQYFSDGIVYPSIDVLYILKARIPEPNTNFSPGAHMDISNHFQFSSTAMNSRELMQLFNPVVQTQYANNMVFTAPVNPQDSLMRAIEALRAAPAPAPASIGNAQRRGD